MACALRQPVIRGARFFLAHAPGLVRHGSKPSRDIAVAAGVDGSIRAALRPWEAARDYAPNQVLLGARHPDSLWDLPRPWFEASPPGDRRGPRGESRPRRRSTASSRSATSSTWYSSRRSSRRRRAGRSRASAGREGRPGRPGLRAARGRHRGAARRARAGGAAPSALGAADRVHRGGARGGSDARGRRAPREPRRQGDGGPGAAYPDRGRRPRPRVSPLRDQQRRGGGGRSLSARRRQPREGGRRARCAARDQRGRQGASAAGPSTRSSRAAALVDAGVFDEVAVVGGASLAKLGMKFQGHLAKGIRSSRTCWPASPPWSGATTAARRSSASTRWGGTPWGRVAPSRPSSKPSRA